MTIIRKAGIIIAYLHGISGNMSIILYKIQIITDFQIKTAYSPLKTQDIIFQLIPKNAIKNIKIQISMLHMIMATFIGSSTLLSCLYMRYVDYEKFVPILVLLLNPDLLMSGCSHIYPLIKAIILYQQFFQGLYQDFLHFVLQPGVIWALLLIQLYVWVLLTYLTQNLNHLSPVCGYFQIYLYFYLYFQILALMFLNQVKYENQRQISFCSTPTQQTAYQGYLNSYFLDLKQQFYWKQLSIQQLIMINLFQMSSVSVKGMYFLI